MLALVTVGDGSLVFQDEIGSLGIQEGRPKHVRGMVGWLVGRSREREREDIVDM